MESLFPLSYCEEPWWGTALLCCLALVGSQPWSSPGGIWNWAQSRTRRDRTKRQALHRGRWQFRQTGNLYYEACLGHHKTIDLCTCPPNLKNLSRGLSGVQSHIQSGGFHTTLPSQGCVSLKLVPTVDIVGRTYVQDMGMWGASHHPEPAVGHPAVTFSPWPLPTVFKTEKETKFHPYTLGISKKMEVPVNTCREFLTSLTCNFPCLLPYQIPPLAWQASHPFWKVLTFRALTLMHSSHSSKLSSEQFSVFLSLFHSRVSSSVYISFLFCILIKEIPTTQWNSFFLFRVFVTLSLFIYKIKCG